MTASRLLVVTAAVATLLAGCGETGQEEGSDRNEETRQPARSANELPSAPSGQAWASALGLAFLHPVDWEREARETGPGEQLIGFTGPQMTASVTPQVGLGAGRDYPNTLEEAVRLAKTDADTRYPGYAIEQEGPVETPGAQAYRIVATYDAFTEEPAKVRVIDIYLQTPERVQANFFVRAAEPDFEALELGRLAESFRLAGASG